MNQAELIERISDIELTIPQVKECLRRLAIVIRGESVFGVTSSVDVPGLGKFVFATRAARTGRNPRTGEPVAIPAKRAVKFRPAKALRDAVQPSAQKPTLSRSQERRLAYSTDLAGAQQRQRASA